MLASYAARVEQSRGRRYPEPSHPYRNDYQRDRDRIIHSRAFRRLEHKTQVFTRRFSDHFRNRLTHTIEVAQISRTIAARLGLDVDLAETLALVHDIGHPPFGHAGEKALDACMRAHNSYFDHNLHALRIAEDFEIRYASFRGLNLTFEVREGIIKHSHDYSAAEHPELAEYLLDQRPPLEAQLIDLTDEIAYNTADLDDGFEAHILSLEAMRAGSPLFARLFEDVERKWPDTSDKLKFNETLKRVFDALVSDLIDNTERRIQGADVWSIEDVRAHPERLAAFTSQADAERKQIKQLLYDRLYYSEELRPEKMQAEEVVRELFEYWMSHPDALPHSYREQLERDPLYRVVCDYIAGMTDRYILRQYEELFGRSDKAVFT
jgi:dGTPase